MCGLAHLETRKEASWETGWWREDRDSCSLIISRHFATRVSVEVAPVPTPYITTSNVHSLPPPWRPRSSPPRQSEHSFFFFGIYPQTKPCEERRVKVAPSHARRSPSTSAPPRAHLSALAELMAAGLPASICRGWARCAGARLYGRACRECSNSAGLSSSIYLRHPPGSRSGPE